MSLFLEFQLIFLRKVKLPREYKEAKHAEFVPKTGIYFAAYSLIYSSQQCRSGVKICNKYFQNISCTKIFK